MSDTISPNTAPGHTDLMISPEEIDAELEAIARAKLVASILTDNGIAVRSPDDGDLDDVELARWHVCIEIVRKLEVKEPADV